MRIWSLHPKYLDAKGLVALWRETLLAKKVLSGQTKGYKNHPQLQRFKNTQYPVRMLDAYLGFIYAEACSRNYNFDKTKFTKVIEFEQIQVSDGQVAYELQHLSKKLLQRSPKDHLKLPKNFKEVQVVPIFIIVDGEIEVWEVEKPIIT